MNCYIFYKILEIFPLSNGTHTNFVKCVDLLQELAKTYNTTYVNINLYIFIVGFLLNLGLYYILAKLSK